jgi:hypothetical protein
MIEPRVPNVQNLKQINGLKQLAFVDSGIAHKNLYFIGKNRNYYSIKPKYLV